MRFPHIQQLEIIRLYAFCKFCYCNIMTHASRTFFMVMAWDSAELFVVDQFFDVSIRSAHATVGILLQLHKVERHIECIVKQQFTDQRLANSKQELQCFGRLKRANRSGQNSQYTAFRTRRDKYRCGPLREYTAIAGSFLSV